MAPAAQALGESVEAISQRLSESEKNMNTSMQMEIAQQKKDLMPWEQAFSMQSIMQAREFTGWTQANQFELQRLMANQQAGYNWTNAESTRAHQLQMQENDYKNQVGLMEKQNEMALDLWG